MTHIKKHVNLSPEQINRLMEMKIPNSDDVTDEEKWVSNAEKIIDSEIIRTERAIGVFLGDE
jgi:hypothetical protein